MVDNPEGVTLAIPGHCRCQATCQLASKVLCSLQIIDPMVIILASEHFPFGFKKYRVVLILADDISCFG